MDVIKSEAEFVAGHLLFSEIKLSRTKLDDIIVQIVVEIIVKKVRFVQTH